MKTAKEIYVYVLAAIITAGEIGMIIFLLYLWLKGVSTENESIVNLIYGVALAYHSAFMLVIGYFFGSSKGSADKTQMVEELNNLLKKKNEQTS
jgi:hypothetical protein